MGIPTEMIAGDLPAANMKRDVKSAPGKGGKGGKSGKFAAAFAKRFGKK